MRGLKRLSAERAVELDIVKFCRCWEPAAHFGYYDRRRIARAIRRSRGRINPVRLIASHTP
jgi:hypothetical protein